ncbi:pentapeptide repeat-containing protein [Peterkaempfera sp. SMS 1(5)a]|uniref:pentapeptide repeat-containing protein n=1 Tax=Peterkaempfera podocarpi TaxID=3232308 RepID=UPI00366C1144
MEHPAAPEYHVHDHDALPHPGRALADLHTDRLHRGEGRTPRTVPGPSAVRRTPLPAGRTAAGQPGGRPRSGLRRGAARGTAGRPGGRRGQAGARGLPLHPGPVRLRGPAGRGALPGEAVFEAARFYAGARFDGALFDGPVDFSGARFAGGPARFEQACFHGGAAWFAGTRFGGGDAVFDGARFSGGPAWFVRADFCGGYAWFCEVRFEGGPAWFSDARFGGGPADFKGARFSGGPAWFAAASFTGGHAEFDGARFLADAHFLGTRFTRAAIFTDTLFEAGAEFAGAEFDGPFSGPLRCAGTLSLDSAVLRHPVRLRAAAARMSLRCTRLEATAVLELRCTRVDLGDAVLSRPVSVTTHDAPFEQPAPWPRHDLPYERPDPDPDLEPPPPDLPDGSGRRPAIRAAECTSPPVRVTSLRGVDTALLVLTDVDLRECSFAGAYHLDQLRLEGRCRFAAPPPGWHWGRALMPVRRWTRRRVLAEECRWRARRGRPLDRSGWKEAADPDPAPLTGPGPEGLTGIYRQLRKALEDGKDVPGAADFYYGEMEARRHDPGTPRGERWLLHLYWAFSGYGLRASRALAALAVGACVSVLLLMMWGVPVEPVDEVVTGTAAPAGGRLTLEVGPPDLRLPTRLGDRWTAGRAGTAGRVVLDSVAFRASSEQLTDAGGWIERVSRCVEPALLTVAALAARRRVKR